MRISDWSSDVCSSDLLRAACVGAAFDLPVRVPVGNGETAEAHAILEHIGDEAAVASDLASLPAREAEHHRRDAVFEHRAIGQAVDVAQFLLADVGIRSEEHTSELQSLMRLSYAVFCLKQK